MPVREQALPERLSRALNDHFSGRKRFSDVDLSYLRPFQTTPLAQTGDAKKTMVLAEWGLRMKSQYSWATIADLT